jgi:hypothetical protein
MRERETGGKKGFGQVIWSSDLVTGGEELRNREPRPAGREGGGLLWGGERERAGKEKDRE